MTLAYRRFARPGLTTTVAASLALFGCLLHARAFAQSNPAKLDPVVVTAARSPLKLSELLADVTVITRVDIERQAFGGIDDLLRNSGAVEMTRNGGPGSVSFLYIRGAETRHSLVLIDGVRIDSQATGGAPWESIPLSEVERIEIVKGPASAMYGSDAVGGVIQIFTFKGNAKTQLQLGLSTGSLGTHRIDGNLRGSQGILDYAVAASTEQSRGFVLVPDKKNYYATPGDVGYQKHNWSARLGLQLSPQDRLELISLVSHLDAEMAAGGGAIGHAIEDNKVGKLSWHRQWSAALNSQLSYSEADVNYNLPVFDYRAETRIRSYAMESNWRLTEEQRLLFVLERKEDSLNSPGFTAAGGSRASRAENGATLGYFLTSGRFDLQAHARHDQDSEFGSANTGSFGVGYRMTDGLRLLASTGSSFRAPTLYQQGSGLGPNLGMPGVRPLKAESGQNRELGLRYAGRGTEWSVTAYRNLISNLIDFSGSTNSCAFFSDYGGCYGNVQAGLLQGLSLAASTQTGNLHLSGTLDLQAPKDLSTGLLLARRARQYGTLHATMPVANWQFGAGLQLSGQRYDNAANTLPLAGYGLLNFDAHCPLTPQLRLQLNLDNALNRVYQTAGGFAQAPRTVMVGLRYSPAL